MQNIEHEALTLIKKKMAEKGWNNSDLAKRMQMHKSSVSKMLIADRIRLSKLVELSDVFGYNFLRELSDLLALNNPPRLIEDHTACQLRIRELEIENATLLKVLGK
mgnify:CR=1 FL=1|jgi:DNA-binding Xre family transcriptional regulator